MASMALNRSNMKEEARISYKRSMQESLQKKDESGLPCYTHYALIKAVITQAALLEFL